MKTLSRSYDGKVFRTCFGRVSNLFRMRFSIVRCIYVDEKRSMDDEIIEQLKRHMKRLGYQDSKQHDERNLFDQIRTRPRVGTVRRKENVYTGFETRRYLKFTQMRQKRGQQ